MEKSLLLLEGCDFQGDLSARVKKSLLIQRPNHINDCTPFLAPRSSLYSENKKNKEKKNKMWPIQPGYKNWLFGIKIKRWDQFRGK